MLTLEELWSGKLPNYSHLKTLGMLHILINVLESWNLEHRGVFLVYPDRVWGYRLWVRDSKGFKIIIDKDATFNEVDILCLRSDASNKASDYGENGGTKLQVELGPAPDLVNEELVDEEVENVSDPLNEGEDIVQEEEENRHKMLDDFQLTRERVREETKEPSRYRDYLSLVVLSCKDLFFKEPMSHEEAVSCQ